MRQGQRFGGRGAGKGGLGARGKACVCGWVCCAKGPCVLCRGRWAGGRAGACSSHAQSWVACDVNDHEDQQPTCPYPSAALTPHADSPSSSSHAHAHALPQPTQAPSSLSRLPQPCPFLPTSLLLPLPSSLLPNLRPYLSLAPSPPSPKSQATALPASPPPRWPSYWAAASPTGGCSRSLRSARCRQCPWGAGTGEGGSGEG